MALTTKYEQGKLIVVEDFNMDTHKTIASKAHLLSLVPTDVAKNGGALILDTPLDGNFKKGSWNVHWVDYWDVSEISVYDMLRRNRLVLTRSALEWLNNKYGKLIELKQ
jgi:large subunit ribosomal protein L4